jgi:hypothetical protein
MKSSGIRFGLVIACGISLSAAAVGAVEFQNPSTEAATPPETVLTGCLKTHGADTAVAGPSGRLYTLEVKEAVDSPTAATASTPPGTPPPMSTTTYSLDNVGKVDLDKHAGHQVQLTGRMQAPSKAAQESAAAGTPAAAKPVSGGGHRTFHVTALKMVAAKCQ